MVIKKNFGNHKLKLSVLVSVDLLALTCLGYLKFHNVHIVLKIL